jgi:hypothetical protein
LQMLYHGSYIPDLTSVERSAELDTAKIHYIKLFDVTRNFIF